MTRFLFVGTLLPGCPLVDFGIVFGRVNAPPVTVCTVTARCGEPGRGSDSPPDCHSLPRLRFAYPHKCGGRDPSPTGVVLSVDCKGYQVCVILNVVKNLRREWVLGIGGRGKILRLRCAPLRMTRFFGRLQNIVHCQFSTFNLKLISFYKVGNFLGRLFRKYVLK